MAGRFAPGRPLTDHPGGVLQGFELAGRDGVWHAASATIDKTGVVVGSDRVPSPLHVRYAWQSDAKQANLYNRNGLPALPFNTARARDCSATGRACRPEERASTPSGRRPAG